MTASPNGSRTASGCIRRRSSSRSTASPASRRGSASRFAAPTIVVAGTNGKGSTCAMLESIALAAGYRVGLYSKPHLVHFEERCRIGGESVDGFGPAAALRGGRARARRHQPDLLRVHAARDRIAVRGDAARSGHPRGRPGRPARCRQRLRRRLRRHHQHRRRSRRVPRARTANRSGARRRGSCARASRRSSATRCRRAA